MIAAEYPDSGLKPWRFSVSDYRIMAKHNFWTPDERVELIDGILIDLPTPSAAHAQVSVRLNTALQRGAGKPWQVRVGKALQLSARSEMLPDLVLLKRRNYGRAIPAAADALVVIEIADDTTLETDREIKLPLYAAANIPETWIAYLQRQSIVRYHDPRQDGYATAHDFQRGETITSLTLPVINLPVDAVFGPALAAP